MHILTLPLWIFWAVVQWLYNLILELAPVIGIAIGVVAVIAFAAVAVLT